MPFSALLLALLPKPAHLLARVFEQRDRDLLHALIELALELAHLRRDAPEDGEDVAEEDDHRVQRGRLHAAHGVEDVGDVGVFAFEGAEGVGEAGDADRVESVWEVRRYLSGWWGGGR